MTRVKVTELRTGDRVGWTTGRGEPTLFCTVTWVPAVASRSAKVTATTDTGGRVKLSSGMRLFRV
jgi:hypothetical protein